MSDVPPFDRGRDRQKHLRVSIEGALLIERDEGPLELICRELSVGGARLEMSPAPTVGTRLDVGALRLGGAVFELGVVAEVTAATGEQVEIEFIEMDPVAKSNVQAAFTAAVTPMLAERKASSMAMRFNWAFKDAAQLAEVCRVLLASVELHDVWTPQGPSESARQALASGGGGMTPVQLIMLRLVWSLWSGSLELNVAQTLPENARASLEALQKALTRGPAGVEAWLEVERR
jgi:hypothetical protein